MKKEKELTRNQLAFEMYKKQYNQLTMHQQDMVDFEFLQQ